MKSTGIVRKIDNLGRIIIPKEIRDRYDLSNKSAIEIFVDNQGGVLLKKYESKCVVCDSSKNIKQINKKIFCSECAKKLFETN